MDDRLQDIPPNRRILIVDDNAAIHEDFRKILAAGAATEPNAQLDELEAALFSDAPEATARPATVSFELAHAHQGREALERVEAGMASGFPFALAFVDVRMPPGWDGIETTAQLWRVDPSLQIVICTAYSDYSWEQMIAELGISENLVLLKKPFDPAEVLQLAHALTEKWRLGRGLQQRMEWLEAAVLDRTAALRQEITVRQKFEEDLIAARDAAEAASRAKSAFLANMSHEIRTPMNGVLGMCQLLLQTPLTPEQRDLARTLATSGENLFSLLNDILDISKIEADKMTLESAPFDIEDVVDSASQLVAQAATAKGLELVAAVQAAVRGRFLGDETRLRQVLLNLMSNAVKFTSAGEVTLHVRQIKATERAATLEFRVSDTGIGISPEQLRDLFAPFTQADTSITRRFGGSGLGLAICKSLVSLMGGRIEVDSTAGAGSSFHFTIELARCPDAAHAETDAGHLKLDGMHVLVVDDNATNRRYIGHLLSDWGASNVEVASAGDARALAARAVANGRPFDLALIDHRMPDETGISLAAHLTRTLGERAPHLLLLTSLGDQPPAEECQAAGVCSSLLKPLRRRGLIERLLEAVGRREVERALPAPSADVRTPSPVRILIAEDHLVNQKVARLQLRRLGFDPVIVNNGIEALEAARTGAFDVVFMDCQMPEMDGFEATRAIRHHEMATGARHLPIIAMTAGAVMGDRDHCLAAGMDDYLSKPVRWENIPDLLRRHLPELLASFV